MAKKETPVRIRIAAIDKVSKVIDKIKAKFPSLARATSRANTMFGLIQKTTERLRNSLNKVGNAMKSFGKSAMIGITLPVIAAAGYSIKKFVELEDALAQVRGATNLSGEELKEFGKRIQNVSKNTTFSQEELLNLAAAAGEAGVRGVDNLEKFSTTLAILGKTAGVNGEEAADAIAKILNLTGEGAGKVENFGSALTLLGDKYGVNASKVLDQTFAITREISKFGLSSAQVTALAAAIEPLGFNAKQASTALGEAFRGIDNAIRKGGISMVGLSKITGMTSAELKDQFGKDSTVVFQKFLQGLDKIKKNGGPTGEALKFFGASGDKTQIILEALAGSGDKVNAMLKDSVQAFQENTALQAEYAEVTGTLSAKISKFNNKLTVLAQKIGERLAPAVGYFIDVASGFIDFLDAHPKIATMIGVVLLLVAALGPLIFAFGFFITMLPQFLVGWAILKAAMVGFGTVSWAALIPILILIAKIILIGVVIAAVIYVLWEFGDVIMGALSDAWDWVTGKIGDFIDMTKTAIKTIKEFLGFGDSEVEASLNTQQNSSLSNFGPRGQALGGIETSTRMNPEIMSQTNNARVDINVRAPQSTSVVGESQGGFLNINRGLAGAI